MRAAARRFLAATAALGAGVAFGGAAAGAIPAMMAGFLVFGASLVVLVVLAGDRW